MALREVTPSEKLLLLALANYADEHMRCYPSQRRLADDTCLSDRTIRTLLAGLEGRRMISRQERNRGDGSRGTDLITLHFSGQVTTQISGGAEMVSGGVGKPLPGGAEMVSGLTTFEPSLEPVVVADADEWPEKNLAESLAAEVASPWVDPSKSLNLITGAGMLAAWKRAGASWSLDVVPIVRALAAKRRSAVASWSYFEAAVLQAMADRTRTVEVPDARSTGPPGGSFAAQRSAEQAEVYRRVMESENG